LRRAFPPLLVRPNRECGRGSVYSYPAYRGRGCNRITSGASVLRDGERKRHHLLCIRWQSKRRRRVHHRIRTAAATRLQRPRQNELNDNGLRAVRAGQHTSSDCDRPAYRHAGWRRCNGNIVADPCTGQGNREWNYGLTVCNVNCTCSRTGGSWSECDIDHATGTHSEGCWRNAIVGLGEVTSRTYTADLQALILADICHRQRLGRTAGSDGLISEAQRGW